MATFRYITYITVFTYILSNTCHRYLCVYCVTVVPPSASTIPVSLVSDVDLQLIVMINVSCVIKQFVLLTLI